MRRTPIRAVSRKRAKENRERAKALAPVREAQTWCARCGVSGVGLDAHELLSRAQGGSITDVTNCALLCRICHIEITENPRAAAEQGWAISRKWEAS